jgi:septal ring factor EnvC (AmiA/AmiB activator)
MKRVRKYIRKFFSVFSTKYNVQVLDLEHFENKASFKLSALQIFGAFVTTMTILVILTIYLVAFTGLREYIPGYADQRSKEKINDLANLTDSLENKVTSNEKYIVNLQNIFTNKSIKEEPVIKDTTRKYSTIKNSKSKEDSLLRQEVQEEDRYNLEANKAAAGMSNILFFTPVRGKTVQKFQSEKRHYGLTISTKKDETVKSILDGTVLLSVWTPEDNYIIAVQHNDQFVSIYKHCSTLLKNEGDYVKGGEALAFVAQTHGVIKDPYILFELWYRGYPIDPAKFIIF